MKTINGAGRCGEDLAAMLACPETQAACLRWRNAPRTKRHGTWGTRGREVSARGEFQGVTSQGAPPSSDEDRAGSDERPGVFDSTQSDFTNPESRILSFQNKFIRPNRGMWHLRNETHWESHPNRMLSPGALGKVRECSESIATH